MTIKPLGFADMLPALTNRSVDLAVEIEPFVTQGVTRGILATWKKSEEIYAGQQGGVLMYGPAVANLGSDAGDRIMVAYLTGVRDYYEGLGAKGKDQSDMVAILTRYTSVKDAVLYARMGWDSMNPDGFVNTSAIEQDLSWFAAHGYVQQAPDLVSPASPATSIVAG